MSKREERRSQLLGGVGGRGSVPTASLMEIDAALFGQIEEETGLSIVAATDGSSITIGKFTLGETGLIVADGATYEEWSQIGGVLRRLEGSIQWQIGDWCNFGAAAWGEKYADALDDTDYSYQTLRDYAYVAASVDLSIRNRQMSFGHHRVVAPDGAELQALWLEYAALHQQKTDRKFKVNDLKRDRALLIDMRDAHRNEIIIWAIEAGLRVESHPKLRRLMAKTDDDRIATPIALTQLGKDFTYIRDSWHEGMPPETRERLDAKLKTMAAQIDALRAELKNTER